MCPFDFFAYVFFIRILKVKISRIDLRNLNWRKKGEKERERKSPSKTYRKHHTVLFSSSSFNSMLQKVILLWSGSWLKTCYEFLTKYLSTSTAPLQNMISAAENFWLTCMYIWWLCIDHFSSSKSEVYGIGLPIYHQTLPH